MSKFYKYNSGIKIGIEKYVRVPLRNVEEIADMSYRVRCSDGSNVFYVSIDDDNKQGLLSLTEEEQEELEDMEEIAENDMDYGDEHILYKTNKGRYIEYCYSNTQSANPTFSMGGVYTEIGEWEAKGNFNIE